MPITINIEKAREETKHRLREARKSLFAEQDTAYLRAQESGEDTTSIVAEKQRLRDLPELADNASTIEELKSLTA